MNKEEQEGEEEGELKEKVVDRLQMLDEMVRTEEVIENQKKEEQLKEKDDEDKKKKKKKKKSKKKKSKRRRSNDDEEDEETSSSTKYDHLFKKPSVVEEGKERGKRHEEFSTEYWNEERAKLGLKPLSDS